MLLAKGRYWQVVLSKAQKGSKVAKASKGNAGPVGTKGSKGNDRVILSLQGDSLAELSEELRELRELKIEVPLETWNRVVKQVRIDRKLLGGIVLDFTKQKDQLSASLSSDRLYGELQRVVLDATASLVESEALTLTRVEVGAD
jgi:hypothetical protein